MLALLGVRNALLRKYRWKCLMVVNFRLPSSKGWNSIKCFPFTLRGRNLKTQQSTLQLSFWICVWEKLRQVTWLLWLHPLFSKSSHFKMFFVHTKSQRTSVFKFIRFEECFWKAPPSSWRISAVSRPSLCKLILNEPHESVRGQLIALLLGKVYFNNSFLRSYISPAC